MKTIFTLITYFLCDIGYAYNASRCGRSLDGYFPFGGFMSTTSFISSFGACSAIGMVERKKEFFVFNYEQLKLEIAKGQGEYLTAYASLMNCQTEQFPTLISLIRENYFQIFTNSSDSNSLESLIAIDNLIASNPNLAKRCNIEAI